MSKPIAETSNKPRIEIKNVKHTFTLAERERQGADLARSIGALRGVNTEFDQVKANYKAKIAEQEASIDTISTSLMNGFEMRNKRCLVLFNPKERKKAFYVLTVVTEDGQEAPEADPILIEPMTQDDFQQDLLDAEAKFERRKEISLFPPTERDRGVLVLGMFNHKWYAALRISIGNNRIEERLDSEQRAFKNRPDAVKQGGKRAMDWLEKTLKADAKGFEEPLAKVIAAESELAE